MKTLVEPVGHSGQEFVVFPAAVAKYPVADARLQGVDDARGGGKIHIRDGKRQQIGGTKTVGNIVPLGAPCTVTIHDGSKIKHVVGP